jgi:hypothetical protein
MSQLRALPATVLVSLLAACTAGSGPAKQLPTSRDPTLGQEPGAIGPEPATGGREAPGGDQGVTAGDAGGCVQCDVTDSCVISTSQGQQTSDVQLTSSNGQCYLGPKDEGQVIHCDGTLEVTETGANGTSKLVTEHWTPFGSGGFQVSVAGASVQCAPTADQPGTGTVTPTSPSPAPSN